MSLVQETPASGANALILKLTLALGFLWLRAPRARHIRWAVPALVLLVLGSLPVATRADTLTLDGASIDSFSVNTTLKTLSVQMATADALPYLTDYTMGTGITDLFLDEFAIVDGVLTLQDEFEFGSDFVTSFLYETGSDMLTSDVTFTYEAVKTTAGSGGSGGDGNLMPEPSSVTLLAAGLLGLMAFGRKKLTSAGGGHRADCCDL